MAWAAGQGLIGRCPSVSCQPISFVGCKALHFYLMQHNATAARMGTQSLLSCSHCMYLRLYCNACGSVVAGVLKTAASRHYPRLT